MNIINAINENSIKDQFPIFNRKGKISYRADHHLIKMYNKAIRQEEKDNAEYIKEVIKDAKLFIEDEKAKQEESRELLKDELITVDLSGYDTDMEVDADGTL